MYYYFVPFLASVLLRNNDVIQTFLLEGEVPILDFLGIVFGHIYHHYKTTNVLRTPKFVIRWYNGDNAYARMLREKYKAISSDFEMV